MEKALLEHLTARRFTELANACEDIELSSKPGGDLSFIYAVEFCALFSGVHTKFLWKRAEGKYKNNAELAALKEMSVALWDWNPRHFFEVAVYVSWSTPILPFVEVAVGTYDGEAFGCWVNIRQTSLLECVRERISNLIALTFSKIDLNACCATLGLDANSLSSRYGPRGWSVEGQYVLPVRPSAQTASETPQEQLDKLTKFVSFLSAK